MLRGNYHVLVRGLTDNHRVYVVIFVSKSLFVLRLVMSDPIKKKTSLNFPFIFQDMIKKKYKNHATYG